MATAEASRSRLPQAHGINRPRLNEALAELWDYRLGLIVAPAGFGKTTLLAHFGSSLGVPVAWFQACADQNSKPALLATLHRTLAGAVTGLSDGWREPEDAIRALEAAPQARTLLVMDDFHLLGRSGAEHVIARLASDAPPWLAIAVASRAPLDIDTSRLRVSGRLLEIGADDLRFRTWEVERLFGEIYREPLAPEEIAFLARRTEGWAAGLQLFHLATRTKSPQERRRILSSLTGRSRIVREYLAKNVLEAVSDELRRFLLDTSVLGRLSGEICDAFLLRDDSAEMLAEIDRRQLFISELEEDGTYRYHEVFRSYLEAALLEVIGETALRSRFKEAATLLERFGANADSLRAYCRAEEWEEAARLLGRSGREVVEEIHDWTGQLQPSLVGLDPWMKLALARHHRASGRWSQAVSAYREAEESFSGEAGSTLALAERQQIAAWLDTVSSFSLGGSSRLRDAVVHGPNVRNSAEGSSDDPLAILTRGLCRLLSGAVAESRAWFEQAELSRDASPLLAAGAGLADAVAAWLMGDHSCAAKAEWALDEFTRLGVPWLEHLARAVVALSEGSERLDQVAAIRTSFERLGDPWGEALTGLLEGWGRLREGGSPAAVLAQAGTTFRRLGAATFEAWALPALALAEARAGIPGARERAARAAAVGRALDIESPGALALLALATLDADQADELSSQARVLAARGGLLLPDAPATDGTNSSVAPMEIRCFGTFELRIKGRPFRMRDLRPRVRMLLRLLALHKGRPAHREVIIESLWPHTDRDTAVRNLQVAISSLRQALEPGCPRGASSFLVRTGEAYRLALPPCTDLDILRFDERLAAGRAAAAAGDTASAIAAFRQVIELHDGELLPEDGPADWVVKERDRYRQSALEAAEVLARLSLEGADASGAEWSARRALRIDRYHDGMWRLLIEAMEMAGEEAAAARTRHEYRQVLRELGVDAQ